MSSHSDVINAAKIGSTGSQKSSQQSDIVGLQTRSRCASVDNDKGEPKEKKSGFEARYQQMYNEFSPALKQTANQFNFMKDVAEKEKKVQVTQADVLSKCNAGAKKKLSFSEAAKGKFLVTKKKKKELPGHCDACGKTLSRKSNESRHFLISCKANPSRKSAVRKGKGD